MFKRFKTRNNSGDDDKSILHTNNQAPVAGAEDRMPSQLDLATSVVNSEPPYRTPPIIEPFINAMSTPPIENTADLATSLAQVPRANVMDMIAPANSKPSILSEGFSFRGEINAKGAIHVEGTLNGQIQVNELTIGSKGAVEGVVSCHSLHIKGKFAGTAICNELIVTSSASVDGHVVYQTLSVQKGASIKGELLLDK
jgi:cytoskeletal protein CcmA (bactofilin family)